MSPTEQLQAQHMLSRWKEKRDSLNLKTRYENSRVSAGMDYCIQELEEFIETHPEVPAVTCVVYKEETTP